MLEEYTLLRNNVEEVKEGFSLYADEETYSNFRFWKFKSKTKLEFKIVKQNYINNVVVGEKLFCDYLKKMGEFDTKTSFNKQNWKMEYEKHQRAQTGHKIGC